MSLCPCGSQNTYAHCCGLYIEKNLLPHTPEQLMRSRYTAYSMANIAYIKKTMKGVALNGFNESEAKEWASNVVWLGLEVTDAQPTDSNIGYVAFNARFMDNGRAQTISELSEFHREDGVWFYVQCLNTTRPTRKKEPPTARNNPCPCGSGKKYKNCHAEKK